MGIGGKIRDRRGNGDHEGMEDHAVNRSLRMGADERRMHVRAYNHWISLLKGRPFPAIADLDPSSIADFGPNSVLLDFSESRDDPAIRYLGQALRDESEFTTEITHVSQVPSGSLLSHLIDHYRQIFANRAPIGFEAEFVNIRGYNTLCRGILMPFSTHGAEIDAIYGVVNWKEMVDDALQAMLIAEVEAARRDGPAPQLAAPIWADGPNATPARSRRAKPVNRIATSLSDAALADHLLLAREAVASAEARGRKELHQALARAYNFALAADDYPDAYQRLIEQVGLSANAEHPMQPIVSLVFSADYAPHRLDAFAATLARAKQNAVPVTALADMLDMSPDACNAALAKEDSPPDDAAALATLRERPALAVLPIPTDNEFILFVGRKAAGGIEIVAQVEDQALTHTIIRKALL